MRCDKCGHEEVALKTCRRRDGEGTGVLCDECCGPLAHRVWIVPGPVGAFGKCASCGAWESVRELRDPRLGGRKDAWTGTCRSCVV